MSHEAELIEMGDPVWFDGVERKGVVSDLEVSHKQIAGGRRDVATFSVFVSEELFFFCGEGDEGGSGRLSGERKI